MFKFIDYSSIKNNNIDYYKNMIKLLQNKVIINHICYGLMKPVDLINFLHVNNGVVEKILHSNFDNFSPEEDEYFTTLMSIVFQNLCTIIK